MSGGLMYNDKFLKHVASHPHPERPERLVATWELLKKSGIVDSAKLVEAREASVDELALVHDREYVTAVLDAIEGEWGFLDPDTFFSPDTKEASLLAAGGVIELANAVFNKDVDWGFALPRPPGHHATKRRSMGFCIFDNIAIAAASLLEKDAGKILIFDWDVHHGNGTQDIFYNDPRVMFISVHQWPHYPGSGLTSETGSGKGLGYTLNIPYPSGASDVEYAYVMDRVFDRMVDIFEPDMIMVSAGFDPYEHDMLAGMNVSVPGFAHMARKIRDAAVKTGRGPCFVLEGGYDLEALSTGITQVCRTLEGEDPPVPEGNPRGDYTEVVESLITNLEPFWPDL